ncbi:MAG TPA: tetratricopeptide repeat protein [Acidimicrobiales bacterium]|nr:tetratricopeptide repeat protein [Acidimicrobiales bacterium]
MRTLRLAKRTATDGRAPDLPAEALEQEREFLLRSLDDLDRERAAGDMDEQDYRALRDGYTARAAAVLRALERAQNPTGVDASPDRVPAPAAPASSGERLRRSLRPIIVAALVGGVAVGAGLLVAGSAGDRLPGQTASGSLPAGEADRLAQARRLLSQRKTVEAIKKFDEVLRTDPRQPEALAYRGWLLRLAGAAASAPQLIDRGQRSVEAAIAADPSYPDAHFFLGVILLEDRKQPAAAVGELRQFLASNPPPGVRSAVEEVLNRALADSGQTPPSATTSVPASP